MTLRLTCFNLLGIYLLTMQNGNYMEIETTSECYCFTCIDYVTAIPDQKRGRHYSPKGKLDFAIGFNLMPDNIKREDNKP